MRAFFAGPAAQPEPADETENDPQVPELQRAIFSWSGLGLAFCRKMMDAHHGFIWVESELAKGSSFITLFPLPVMPEEEE